jgi:hypothetical protein
MANYRLTNRQFTTSAYAQTSKPTIWEALREKLGREPTHTEACDEVRRIIASVATKREV